jgi:hypothetical protein
MLVADIFSRKLVRGVSALVFSTTAALCYSARADLQVNHRKDKVVLVDGTEIVCLVLMETKSGVLIVEADPKDKEKTRQRVISNDQVSKVIHGKPDGTIAGFQTEAELAHKVVQGTGFRKEESDEPKINTSVAGWGQAQGTSGEKPVVANNVPQSALSPKELQEAYMARFPGLKDASSALLGNERTTQLIEQALKGDPLVRKEMENFLGLFVKTETKPAAPEADTSITPSARPIKVKPVRPVAPKENKEN